MKTSMNSKRRKCEQGGSLVEFVLLIPLLSLLLTGAYEASRALHQYLILTNIVYQSTRAGSQMDIGSLSAGCATSNSMTLHGMEENPASANEALLLVLRRAEYLINSYQSELSVSCPAGARCEEGSFLPELSSEVIAVNATGSQLCGESNAARNTLSVTVTGVYTPLVLSMFQIPFSVTSSAYLLANNQTFSTPQQPNPSGSCGGKSVTSSYAASYSDFGSLGRSSSSGRTSGLMKTGVTGIGSGGQGGAGNQGISVQSVYAVGVSTNCDAIGID